MDYIYISSGYFGSLILRNLTKKPKLVITQPDRLGGRGMKTLISTEVKKTAIELNIPFHKVHSKSELEQELGKYIDYVVLLCDFGMVIPVSILTMTKYGIWNIHPSLLPKYRGSTPIPSAILNNERETGVSVIQMDEAVDHGDILAQQSLTIYDNDTTTALMTRLAPLGVNMFGSLLSDPDKAMRNKQKQNHTEATYTKKLTKDDGYVKIEQISSYLEPIFKKYNLMHLLPTKSDIQLDSNILHNKIRALTPWPGIWTKTERSTIIKIEKSNLSGIMMSCNININGKKYN